MLLLVLLVRRRIRDAALLRATPTDASCPYLVLKLVLRMPLLVELEASRHGATAVCGDGATAAGEVVLLVAPLVAGGLVAGKQVGDT